MDRLSVLMVKSSLCWLLAGFVIGGLMLIDRAIPGDWRLWMMPSHGHMLFVRLVWAICTRHCLLAIAPQAVSGISRSATTSAWA